MFSSAIADGFVDDTSRSVVQQRYHSLQKHLREQASQREEEKDLAKQSKEPGKRVIVKRTFAMMTKKDERSNV